MPYFPPDIPNSITHIKAEVTIDAPVEVVWKALVDFPSYEKWNTFVRQQLVTDSKFKPLEPQPEPAEGSYIRMLVRMPPAGLEPPGKGLTVSDEVITFLEEQHHRVGWKAVQYPNWLLRAHRWQEVTEVIVDGKKMAKYTTVETFNGPFAWPIRFFMRGTLNTCFEAMAKALKEHSEKVVRDASE
ncbi:hypothetical protein M422DRAFT_69460 [Sphaerobolus stellatus SS14]|uniref:Coenzyme Q-binding protein COQ10 START domain-containing protein n=1 Tax=Sphaerobolus stellatus (strain SS14) TaxID=990650 RepID=A0A0C9VHK6_SPHS4|nr:hypothetical protein M422DRAFT_69460 [Sphaerobolus stellatus SS14]